jgi:FkbM family methyltransferase
VEVVRSWIRNRVGYDSPLYVFAAKLADLYFAASREGVSGVRLLRMKYQTGPGSWRKFRRLMHPIFIRPGTTDVGSIIDNIFREEYGQLPREFRPKTIVDAGAYVGDTAAYFLSRFAEARVFALEPNPESYRLALQNLSAYGDRVIVSPLALWESEGTVRFVGEQTGASIAEEGIEVRTTTVEAILDGLGVDRIDLMKMDIEGAELTVLNSGVGGWLRAVQVLLLETHGRDIEDQAISLLEREGYRIHRHRNVWYCMNAVNF